MTIKRGKHSRILDHDNIAGVDIVAGQVVWTHPNYERRLMPVDAKDVDYQMIGVAMHEASEGQEVIVAIDGEIEYLDTEIIPGCLYVIDPDNPGAIVPFNHLSAGDRVHFVGMGKRDNVLRIMLASSYCPLGKVPAKRKRKRGKRDTQELRIVELDDSLPE